MRFRGNSPGKATRADGTRAEGTRADGTRADGTQPAGIRVPRPRRRPGTRVFAAAGATIALAATVAGVTAAGLGQGGASAARGSALEGHAGSAAASVHRAVASAGGHRAAASAGGRRIARASQGTHPAATAAAGRAAAPRRGTSRGGQPGGAGTPGHKALRTSCRSVAHIGDSTSVDLISAAFLPDAAQRLGARYAAVGVRHLKIDASGGRSIVEEMPGQINGYKVASAWHRQGYRGCWVFALGTNDTANVAAGSTVGMMARIDQMMAVAHGQPVMWVNTRTLLSSGPWASANERAWDQTLVRALAKYPNMRIFNWSAVARPAWFLPDGIHYNTVGCAMRAKAIADALARAFPADGHSAGTIVK